MTAVLVELQTRPPEPTTAQPVTHVEVVEELDTLVESAMCSCSAGDDNPY